MLHFATVHAQGIAGGSRPERKSEGKRCVLQFAATRRRQARAPQGKRHEQGTAREQHRYGGDDTGKAQAAASETGSSATPLASPKGRGVASPAGSEHGQRSAQHRSHGEEKAGEEGRHSGGQSASESQAGGDARCRGPTAAHYAGRDTARHPKSGASERASEGSSMWVAQSSRPKIATSIARGVHAAARRQEIERGMERSGVRALQLQETNNNLAAVEARARTWHFSTSVDHQRERERAMVAEKVRQKRATAQERQWVLEHVGVAAVTEVQSHGGGNDHNAHSNAARLHLNQRPRPRCHSARCSKVRVLGEFVGGGPEAEKGEA